MTSIVTARSVSDAPSRHPGEAVSRVDQVGDCFLARKLRSLPEVHRDTAAEAVPRRRRNDRCLFIRSGGQRHGQTRDDKQTGYRIPTENDTLPKLFRARTG
jgi:hypothetical protein